MATSTIYGLKAAEITVFSGLNTLQDATSLPPYMSPSNQDVVYVPGLVKTRPGLTQTGSTITGSPSVNYLKDYTQPNLVTKLLGLTSTGDLILPETLDVIAQNIILNARAQSNTLFGKEFIAVSDGAIGVDLPRQYNGTNVDRVSQVGPAESPTVADYLPNGVIIANSGAGVAKTIEASPLGLQPTNYETFVYDWIDTSSGFPERIFEYVTYPTALLVTTTAAHGFSVGDYVIIAGATDPTFDGAFSISEIVSTTEFMIGPWWIDVAASGGGTATVPEPSASRVNNVVTITTATAHTFLPGMTVNIYDVPNVSLGGALTATSRVNGVVTITTTTAHGFPVGSTVLISGVTDSTFDGQFTVLTVPNATTFTYEQAAADATSSGGTANDVFNGQFIIVETPTSTTFTYNQVGPNNTSSTATAAAIVSGNVEAGLHQVAVSFVTREGYTTPPSPPTLFNAGGGKLLSISNILLPLGLSNVIGRLLIFTPVLPPSASLSTVTSSFYTIRSKFFIRGNVDTDIIVDFSDQELLSGENVDQLFEQIELQESAGVLAAGSRLIWWGTRNNSQTFLNLTFDGGWNSAPDYPKGWTRDPTSGLGGLRTFSGIWGSDYTIIGDGVTAIRGLITTGAVNDVFGVPRIAPYIAYSVRARVKRYGTPKQGNFRIDLNSVTDPIATAGLTVSFSAASETEYLEFSAPLTAALAIVPADLILRVYTNGTVTNSEGFTVDDIEIYPTNEPYNLSTLYVSKPFEPENYDGVDGLVSVAPDNGQAIRSCFQIRDYIYIVKEHGIYVTSDTDDKPALWKVNELSNEVGTPSVTGVGVGDEWAIIAGRHGAYYFGGAQPENISQEIQPTWDTINWTYGRLIEVVVDVLLKRVYIAAPVGASTFCNKVFVLDYVEGFGDPMGAKGHGRKWTIWNTPCNSMAMNLEQELIMGNAVNNGKIYLLDENSASDDGAAINDHWQSGYVSNPTRLLLGYISAEITGVGTASLLAYYGDQSTVKSLRGWALAEFASSNRERQLQVQRERVSFRVGSNVAGHRFSLQGLYLWVNEDQPALIRGRN